MSPLTQLAEPSSYWFFLKGRSQSNKTHHHRPPPPLLARAKVIWRTNCAVHTIGTYTHTHRTRLKFSRWHALFVWRTQALVRDWDEVPQCRSGRQSVNNNKHYEIISQRDESALQSRPAHGKGTRYWNGRTGSWSRK